MDLQPVDTASATPPYEQLRLQVVALVRRGSWEPGHRLPSVRAAAAELGLAPNTVARSYRLLETDGVVETRGRRGTVVAGTALPDAGEVSGAATAFASRARSAGLTLSQATRLLEEQWPG